MRYCLDSWAVLRWLEGTEPAASRVDNLLAGRPVMSWINLGEVFYVVHRLAGEQQAKRVLKSLRPQLDLDLPSSNRILQAAAIKAVHPMAYADAFAAATAAALDCVLVTGDPELLGPASTWMTEDLR